jgi:hypothetical protein
MLGHPRHSERRRTAPPTTFKIEDLGSGRDAGAKVPARSDRRGAGRRVVRVFVRVRATALDRALARGDDPAASPMLAARAARIATAKNRRALADGLELVIRGAQDPQRRRRVAAPRASVLANAAALAELATLLRCDSTLFVRGLAMLACLLTDGTGPLYARGGAANLATVLSEARAALVG